MSHAYSSYQVSCLLVLVGALFCVASTSSSGALFPCNLVNPSKLNPTSPNFPVVAMCSKAAFSRDKSYRFRLSFPDYCNTSRFGGKLPDFSTNFSLIRNNGQTTQNLWNCAVLVVAFNIQILLLNIIASLGVLSFEKHYTHYLVLTLLSFLFVSQLKTQKLSASWNAEQDV